VIKYFLYIILILLYGGCGGGSTGLGLKTPVDIAVGKNISGQDEILILDNSEMRGFILDPAAEKKIKTKYGKSIPFEENFGSALYFKEKYILNTVEYISDGIISIIYKIDPSLEYEKNEVIRLNGFLTGFFSDGDNLYASLITETTTVYKIDIEKGSYEIFISTSERCIIQGISPYPVLLCDNDKIIIPEKNKIDVNNPVYAMSYDGEKIIVSVANGEIEKIDISSGNIEKVFSYISTVNKMLVPNLQNTNFYIYGTSPSGRVLVLNPESMCELKKSYASSITGYDAEPSSDTTITDLITDDCYAKSETWTVIYDDVSKKYIVSGSISGMQPTLAEAGNIYNSTSGGISFKITVGSLPSGYGDYFLFSTYEYGSGLPLMVESIPVDAETNISGNKIYVLNAGGRSITILNTESISVEKTIR